MKWETMTRIFSPKILLILLLALPACMSLEQAMKLSLPEIPEGAQYVGSESCGNCHENLFQAFGATLHGRIADFEVAGSRTGCESCHGPGSLHQEQGDSSKIIYFSALEPEQSTALCLKCHSDGDLMIWRGSEHHMANVGCTDCHKIHQNKGMLKADEPGLCYECHRELEAKTSFPSHHPIREGKMTCSDCHQQHGSVNRALAKTDERVADLCMECHSKYQGPFVFEHAPVQEDCSICHDPHGTVANNLLKQNEPFLCLQCHEGHFHLLRRGFSDSVTRGGDITGNTRNTDYPGARDPYLTGNTPGSSTAAGLSATGTIANAHGLEGFAKSFGTKCTQCHQQVHGSDLPSQSVPSQGGKLTR